MSRTHRNPKARWWSHQTLKGQIDWNLEHQSRNPYRWIKKRKSQEQYDREVRAADREYRKLVKENNGSEWHFVRAYSWVERKYVQRYERIRHPYVSRYYRIKLPYTREEAIEEAKREWAERSRDGYLNESTRNSGFKRDAKKEVRLANKTFCKKVLDGEDYDDEPYPTRKLGKKHVWSWW